MALPKIDLPTYKLDLKTSNRTITFRPFIVKEEKLLMIAMESNDFDTVMSTIKQVINNCMLEDIDVDNLPLFELEHIFLNLRARSAGETVELSYVCRNDVEDKKCGGKMLVEVDLLKVDLETPNINQTIKFNETVGIKLRYPTVSVSKIISEQYDSLDVSFKVIEHCTEYLFDDQQVYKPEDMQPGEFIDFIQNLTQDQFQSIKKFFDNLPTIKYNSVATCSKCGKEHEIKLEGLLDFFE